MKIKFLIMVGILAMALAATPAFATVQSQTFDIGIGNDALQNYTGNFATLTISVDDGGDGSGPLGSVAKFDLVAGSGQIVGQPDSCVKYGILGGPDFLGLNVKDTSKVVIDETTANYTFTVSPFTGTGPGPLTATTYNQVHPGIDGFGSFNIKLNSNPPGGVGSGSAFFELTFQTTGTYADLGTFIGLLIANPDWFAAVDIGVFNCDYTATGVTGFAANGTNPKVVPIPGSMLLLGTGLIGLAGLGWRRRKS